MKVGRFVGDVVQRIPGLGGHVGRLRFGLRQLRLARRHLRGGGQRRRYETWVRVVDTPSSMELALLRARTRSSSARPVISILMPLDAPEPHLLDRAIHSIRRQVHQGWELCIVSPRSPLLDAVLLPHETEDHRISVQRLETAVSGPTARNLALRRATGAFVSVMDAVDVLPPQALLSLAEEVERRPRVGLVYGDEDRIDAHGTRQDPWFKCDCNPELLLTHDAISRPAIYSRSLVHELQGWREECAGAEDYDLALRAVDAVGTGRVVHVPRILCHRGSERPNDPATAAAGRRAVADRLRGRGSAATVEPAPELPSCNRIRHPLPARPPLVSIIICTRDHEHLLRVAVESITRS